MLQCCLAILERESEESSRERESERREVVASVYCRRLWRRRELKVVALLLIVVYPLCIVTVGVSDSRGFSHIGFSTLKYCVLSLCRVFPIFRVLGSVYLGCGQVEEVLRSVGADLNNL